MKTSRAALIADELLVVRHSGEIPEVALHSAIHYLTQDPSGPGLRLEEREFLELKKMVVERYKEIIHRDLDPGNRDKSLYRGIARCIANWQRLEKFCCREEFDLTEIRKKTRDALLFFLNTETCDVAEKRCCSSINCTTDELEWFLESIQLDGERITGEWRLLCTDP